MKFYFSFLFILLPCTAIAQNRSLNSQSSIATGKNWIWLDKAIAVASVHYKNAVVLNPDVSKIPRSTKPDGSLRTVNSSDWCSGFFSGSLWQIYGLNKDSTVKSAAIKWMSALENEQYNKTTHDLGFMMYNSYGNAYKATQNTGYKEVIIQSARSLLTRFNPKIGLIKSWDGGKWQYPVIIDNMMNLELLLQAGKLSGDTVFKKVAITHANNTLKNHFRSNFSSYHVVDYDTISGLPRRKQTNQGYSDESAWARGQAWGLYGFTMMYRYTRDVKYLTQAKSIAKFILTNPNLPNNKIPYWDFNDPAIPNTYRDASAAAIMASAFLELYTYLNKKDNYRRLLFKTAIDILYKLSMPQYTSQVGANSNFILQHCVGNMPIGTQNGEIDAGICYADYYYIEALGRLKRFTVNFN
ncbi:glycoside hydrolase family 88 protein [uncultured Mucilaginibacter sp.]|uniref:glycoside hydrolase family 88 protein n=1 Tax=uncultured Mucilaginibacter sp. TaxID=797541 RepID=UPI0025D5B1DD|nr:glycoside hydrolase family 88 protein [uncultured Mucilaginibacter sp.]